MKDEATVRAEIARVTEDSSSVLACGPASLFVNGPRALLQLQAIATLESLYWGAGRNTTAVSLRREKGEHMMHGFESDAGADEAAHLGGEHEADVATLAPTEPLRCDICGSERIHVYPADALADRMAVCLTCGAHYHENLGWLDPEDL